MRLLFISPPHADYLSATLLHGLRTQAGVETIDFPRYNYAYSDYPVHQREAVYGRGFTAFFGCCAFDCDRTEIDVRIAKKEFDLIVVADIWSSWPWLAARTRALCGQQVVVVDGADTAQVYPYAGLWWRHVSRWSLPRVHRNLFYFKREWTSNSQFNVWHRLVPLACRSRLRQAGRLRRISFSIPEEKIVGVVPEKRKDFPMHIVDPEVAAHVRGAAMKYAFRSEEEYYADLKVSRFGVTTKRAGWDCLRHYEIAANGCVPCFRDLAHKPETCAPHGLMPGRNCISYSSVGDLFNITRTMDREVYARLGHEALQWARANTTKLRAQQFLRECQSGDSCFPK